MATEFWFAVIGYGVGFFMLYKGETHDSALMFIGISVGYGLARGVAKHGYGKAINKPNVTRI
jgi:hypothetical protein